MASAFSHAIAVFGVAAPFRRGWMSWRVLLLGMFLSVLPDADVIGFRFGVPYGHPLGHRGLTHSFFFAALLAGLLAAAFGRRAGRGFAGLWLFFFLSTASHGVLDALTDGGLGVAFFAPFDNHRYFFPFRPIHVSPIGIGAFFTARAWKVLSSELLWVWLPSLIVAGAMRWGMRPKESPEG